MRFLKTIFLKSIGKLILKLCKLLGKIRIFFSGKALLIIKLDSIGDYILFRNNLETLKKSRKYLGFKLLLCGNMEWRNIVDCFDSSYVDMTIWVDKRKFVESSFYRLKKACLINILGIAEILHPTFSREYLVDKFIDDIEARHKIGMIGDLSNITSSQKKETDKYYTGLVDIPTGVRHEFLKNEYFINKVIQEKIHTKPEFNLNKKKDILSGMPKKYIVLFPGSRSDDKMWNMKNYKKLFFMMPSEKRLPVFVCGGDKEKQLEKEINTFDYDKPITNLMGKTSLEQLVAIISKASLLISSDSCAIHIAMVFNTPTICLSNGNHFGRFVDYPKELFSNISCVYPPQIMNNINNKEYLCERYKYVSGLNVNDIQPEAVLDIINPVQINDM